MHPPDRHCERKTAGREQTRYLFSCNLWVGVAPRGQERVACSAASHTCSLSPSPSVTSLSASLVFPNSLPASLSTHAQTLPPQWEPWVRLGLWQGMSPSAGVLPQEGRLGIVIAAHQAALFLSLFDLRGSFFGVYCILLYLVGCLGGWGEEEELVLMGFVGTFRNFYQSHV